MRRTFVAAFLLFAALARADFTLTILHTNDCHARVEPTKIRGKAYGGYPRMAAYVSERMRTDPNPILLSAGDVFQGTLYFNVYEGLADLAFMNLMGYTAMALGNHELDNGPKTLAPFVVSAKFPILCANMDFAKEPELAGKVKPSTVVEIGGQKIGIVGAITDELLSISSPGPNVSMKPLVASIQAEVDRLAAEGIDKIVLLTHCGYDVDKDTLAKQVRGIDVIVGGHSHSLLGKFDDPNLSRTEGPYPTVVEGADKGRVLVVQAWDWGKVVGRLQVVFDDKGAVKSWSGEPKVLDESMPEDPVAAAMAAAFRKPIDAVASEVVGLTEKGIDRLNNLGGESPVGNVIADAQLAYTRKAGAEFAFMNGGGVRASIDAGPITYAEAIAVQPFGNTLTLLELTGEEIHRALEWGVAKLPEASGALVHVSKGTSYEVDLSKPEGSRVGKVVLAGQPLDPKRTYRVVLNTFMANGGDGHEVLKNAKGRRVDLGFVDIDALVDYFRANRPLEARQEGRIVIRK